MVYTLSWTYIVLDALYFLNCLLIKLVYDFIYAMINGRCIFLAKADIRLLIWGL